MDKGQFYGFQSQVLPGWLLWFSIDTETQKRRVRH